MNDGPVRKFCGMILLLVVIGIEGPSLTWGESDASSFAVKEVVKRGVVEMGMNAGYWQAVDVVGNAPSANRNAVFVLPKIGIVLTDPIQAKFLTGNLELLVEPLFARFVQPFAAEAAGGSLVLQYNLLSFGRWMPFWDAGAGMLWTNLAPRIPEQSTPFNFVLETGPGIHYFVTKSMTVSAGVRFHHISNAGIGDRNTGINAVLSYAGFSFFLPDVL